MAASKYMVNPAYQGKDVYTIEPEYSRPQGGKFTITSDDLTAKDKKYLYEVIGHPSITTKEDASQGE